VVNVTVHNLDLHNSLLTNGFNYGLPSPMPTISSVVHSGPNLELVWIGGTNQACPLLLTTNVALPRASWAVWGTNLVGADGWSTNSLPINQAEPQRFYLLSVSYN
jgi:hypothetical protein